MQRLIKITRGLSSPPILITAVWCVTLVSVAVGPIDYPLQPSIPVLLLVGVGVMLFCAGYSVGGWCFRAWLPLRLSLPAAPVSTLNIAVVATSLLGMTGVALIAFDRVVLSGVSNSGYAEMLRCAPELVDFIEIRRTPLLYAGYLTFSFGFASLVLFLLKGEEVRGWAAVLAQLSIVCPVGYALLYSGRMPILLAIALAITAVLVRIGQDRPPLPHGHHLVIKTIAVLVLFGIYTNAMWLSRRSFCAEMGAVISELGLKKRMQEAERSRALQTKRASEEQNAVERERQQLDQKPAPEAAAAIHAADLSKMIDAKALSGGARQYSPDVNALVRYMREGWHTSPRPYVLSAIESGRLSPRTAFNLLNTYFYLTHGISMLDRTWRAREQFSPHWGIYEIGVLSPILRVFAPQNQQLPAMSMELRAADISGFFPTVWAAAFIDFGAVGAVIYILIWGFAAGWAAYGTRHSSLTTPTLLQTFILASILLSPVQGPLGIANSALVLVSMVIVGVVVDFGSWSPRKEPTALESGTSHSGQVSTS